MSPIELDTRVFCFISPGARSPVSYDEHTPFLSTASMLSTTICGYFRGDSGRSVQDKICVLEFVSGFSADFLSDHLARLWMCAAVWFIFHSHQLSYQPLDGLLTSSTIAGGEDAVFVGEGRAFLAAPRRSLGKGCLTQVRPLLPFSLPHHKMASNTSNGYFNPTGRRHAGTGKAQSRAKSANV
jgi:hypothetical protein